MDWKKSQSNVRPQLVEVTPHNLYFRKDVKENEGSYEYLEAVWPLAHDETINEAKRACYEIVLAEFDMGALDLLKELVAQNVASPEELPGAYNVVLEAWLKVQRVNRGYTDREPSQYAISPVTRYKTDAIDWENYKGRAMIYALTNLNEYKTSGTIPTFDDFIAGIGEISWTIDPNNENPGEGMVIEN